MGAIWYTYSSNSKTHKWYLGELEDIGTTSVNMLADITDNPNAFPHEANIWKWYNGGWTENNDIHVSVFPEGKSSLCTDFHSRVGK